MHLGVDRAPAAAPKGLVSTWNRLQIGLQAPDRTSAWIRRVYGLEMMWITRGIRGWVVSMICV